MNIEFESSKQTLAAGRAEVGADSVSVSSSPPPLFDELAAGGAVFAACSAANSAARAAPSLTYNIMHTHYS